MAKRPIFVPNLRGNPPVVVEMIEFEWFPGLSIAQKQRSIESLHRAVGKRLGFNRPLEISTKSNHPDGVRVSAFNLTIAVTGQDDPVCVESVYQSSKVFENGGPFRDLLDQPPGQGKKDARLQNSGRLIHFDFWDQTWPLEPQTHFYDWLYILALKQNSHLAAHLLKHECFTDIEFNPKKSMSCQAHAAAIFCALVKLNLLDQALNNQAAFQKLYSQKTGAYHQLQLF
jgi:hypothetical protein